MTGAMSGAVTAASRRGKRDRRDAGRPQAAAGPPACSSECLFKGDVPPISVSEGGLEHEYRCDFPRIGETLRPGYKAARCSRGSPGLPGCRRYRAERVNLGAPTSSCGR